MSRAEIAEKFIALIDKYENFIIADKYHAQ